MSDSLTYNEHLPISEGALKSLVAVAFLLFVFYLLHGPRRTAALEVAEPKPKPKPKPDPDALTDREILASLHQALTPPPATAQGAANWVRDRFHLSPSSGSASQVRSHILAPGISANEAVKRAAAMVRDKGSQWASLRPGSKTGHPLIFINHFLDNLQRRNIRLFKRVLHEAYGYVFLHNGSWDPSQAKWVESVESKVVDRAHGALVAWVESEEDGNLNEGSVLLPHGKVVSKLSDEPPLAEPSHHRILWLTTARWIPSLEDREASMRPRGITLPDNHNLLLLDVNASGLPSSFPLPRDEEVPLPREIWCFSPVKACTQLRMEFEREFFSQFYGDVEYPGHRPAAASASAVAPH